MDLLVSSLLSFFSLFFLDLIKHLEDFLEETRNGTWVSNGIRGVKDSQDACNTDNKALLLVCALEALLALGQLDNNQLSNLFLFHVFYAGARIVIKCRKEDLKQMFLQSWLTLRLHSLNNAIENILKMIVQGVRALEDLEHNR